jgi:hypothetical protein
MSDIITTHEIKCCEYERPCLELCASQELDFTFGFQTLVL